MHDTPEPPPDVAIVEAVADKEGVDEGDLPPIADVVDPDALNALFHSIDEAHLTDAHFQFEYCDYTVHITGDQTITIE